MWSSKHLQLWKQIQSRNIFEEKSASLYEDNENAFWNSRLQQCP